MRGSSALQPLLQFIRYPLGHLVYAQAFQNEFILILPFYEPMAGFDASVIPTPDSGMMGIEKEKNASDEENCQMFM